MTNINELNDAFEYKVEAFADDSNGTTNVIALQDLLDKYSKLGWRLKTVVSNAFIFERRIKTSEMIAEDNKIKAQIEQEKREQIEQEQLRIEQERIKQAQYEAMAREKIEQSRRDRFEEERENIIQVIMEDSVNNHSIALTKGEAFVLASLFFLDKSSSVIEIQEVTPGMEKMEILTYLKILENKGRVGKDDKGFFVI